jgi:hypothetical protein
MLECSASSDTAERTRRLFLSAPFVFIATHQPAPFALAPRRRAAIRSVPRFRRGRFFSRVVRSSCNALGHCPGAAPEQVNREARPRFSPLQNVVFVFFFRRVRWRSGITPHEGLSGAFLALFAAAGRAVALLSRLANRSPTAGGADHRLRLRPCEISFRVDRAAQPIIFRGLVTATVTGPFSFSIHSSCLRLV